MHGNGIPEMTQPALKNLKTLPYGGAGAVDDHDMDVVVNNLIQQSNITAWLKDDDLAHRFLHQYRSWIAGSQLNKLTGLEQFPIACYSQGTSEAFDKFYLKNHRRRFRCFRGEYMYHAASWRNYFPDWTRLEDAPVDSNDAVVISLPFSDTGQVHVNLIEVLEQCEKLQVPVLIDCAFFGICSDIEFDFSRYQCVTDITFSLSKTFPVSHVRIGMRLTRQDDDDSLLVHHKTGYVNRIGAGLGIELMNRFSADYNTCRWKQTQIDMCESLGLEPSSTVIFGLDLQNKYPEYNRGGTANRLCLARYLAAGTLPDD